MFSRKFLNFSLIVLLTFVILLFIYGFDIQKRVHFLKKYPQKYIIDILEPEPLFQEFPQKHYCLNGINPANLTSKQQLEEFIKGPCSPIIIVPGLLGTSLIVEIDCELLKSENPDIFSNCGWETCSSSEFWKESPKKEYKLWLTDIFSPLSMFSIFESQHNCFNSLIQLSFNKTSTNDEERYASPKGIRINWFGNTTDTKDSNDCGLSSIRDLSGLFHLECDTEGFGKFIESFMNLGYQNSITFQALPYDFRKGLLYNNFQNYLKRTLKYLNELTGKKVTIIGHSMGNNYVLHTLRNMSQKSKDEQIFEFIAIGAPFTGTMNALQSELSGFKEFQFYNIIGLDFASQKSFLASPSLYECLPFDSFERFKDEEWMEEFRNRIDQEKKYPIKTTEGLNFWSKNNYSLDWLPSPTENCGNQMEKDKKCTSNIIDFSSSPLIKIQNRSFYSKKQDLFDLISDYVPNDNSSVIYEEALKTNLHLLENPNIPITILYSTLLNTTRQINYQIDPKENTLKKNEFFWDEELTYGKGDGNVLVNSVLLPASKWIWENKNNYENSKSIKIFEICSDYKKNFNENATLESNIYSGYKCQCLDTKNIKNCQHSCLISDSGVIDLVFKIINKHPKLEVNKSLPEIDFDSLKDKCFTLNLPLGEENIIDFLKRNK